mgnify:CR=1 FL=1
MDDANGTITGWIDDFKAGDSRAFTSIWDHYFAQLVRMIRARLCASPGPTAVRNEEDIALSVLASLSDGVRADRFPKLDDRDDLWKVLAHLVKCKLSDRRRRLKALKNPDLRTLREADMIATGSSSGSGEPSTPFGRLLAEGPSPGMAAEMAEQLRLRLDALVKPDARRIAELKLEGYTNEEIAAKLECSLRKVTLRLEYIRETWQESAADDQDTNSDDEV